MSNTDDTIQERTGESTPERRQIVVVPPEPYEGGRPGKAGIAVTRDPGRAPGTSLTIDQIWPDGKADPVYVGEENALDLIGAIAEVMIDE